MFLKSEVLASKPLSEPISAAYTLLICSLLSATCLTELVYKTSASDEYYENEKHGIVKTVVFWIISAFLHSLSLVKRNRCLDTLSPLIDLLKFLCGIGLLQWFRFNSCLQFNLAISSYQFICIWTSQTLTLFQRVNFASTALCASMVMIMYQVGQVEKPIYMCIYFAPYLLAG